MKAHPVRLHVFYLTVLGTMAAGTAAAQKSEEPVQAATTAQLTARADSLRGRALELRRGGNEGERQAIALLRSEISIRLRLGQPKEAGAAWNISGHAFTALQQYDSAEVAYRRAIVARLEAGDRHGVAASTNNLGIVFQETDRPDSAIAYYQRAVELARDAQAKPLEAALLTNLAIAYAGDAGRDPRRLDSSLEALRSALAIHEQLGASAESGDLLRTLQELGNRHNDGRRADSALFYWRAALDIVTRDSDHRAASGLLYAIAALYDRTELLDSSRVYFVRAAAAAARAGDAAARADAEYRIGDLHTQRGQSDSAVAYYRSALRLARSVGDSSRAGNFLHAIGRDARLAGRLDTAVYYLRAALDVHRASGDREGEARVLDGLARYYNQSGRRDSAVTMFGEALAVRRELGDISAQTYTLIALGDALMPVVPRESQAMRDSSRKALTEALRLASTRGTESLRAAANSALASHYQYWGQADSARAHALLALEVYRATNNVVEQARTLRWIAQAHAAPDSIDAYADRALSLARRVGAQSMEMDVHLGIGQVYSRLFMDDSSNTVLRERSLSHLQAAAALARSTEQPDDLANALQSMGHLHAASSPRRWVDAAAYFDSAWVVLESLRQSSGDDAARIAVGDRLANVNAARLLMWAWGERAGETGQQDDLRRALAARERGRSRALLDMIGREVDDALAGSLDTIAASLINAVKKPGTATLLYTIGQTTTVDVILPSGRVESFETDVSVDTAGARIDVLRNALGVDSAAARASPEPLEQMAPSSTRDLLGGTPSSLTTAEQLASGLKLVADFALPQALRELLEREQIGELVIVPDGPLALIPFAALPVDSLNGLLGERMALRFTPSLVLAARASAPQSAQSRGRSVVVGDPLMPMVTGVKGPVRLNPLQGAAEEGELVAAALGGRLLTGALATEKAVREALATAGVVHLATHGYAYASEHRVRESFVALAPGDGEDGLLTMGELIDEPGTITADLVVLSACQTALGSTTRAEGTVGLQRAFLAKGARSLLVSLWSVDDAVTKTLMVRFYEHWLGGMTKAEALMEAQSDVKRTHPNPRYWAAFQLVGAG